jgi:hypothetical protein
MMLMRFIAVVATILVITSFGTIAVAQNYTDQELRKLFQTQRDAFNAAKQSTTGATRGLKLVTVDDMEASTTNKTATVSVQSDITTLTTPTEPESAPTLEPLTTTASLILIRHWPLKR